MEQQSVEKQIHYLNQIYAALSQTNQAIVRCTDEMALFDAVCRIAVEHGGMAMSWIGCHDTESSRIQPVAKHGVGVDYLDGIEISSRDDKPQGRGPTGTAFREQQVILVQNFADDAGTTPWQERAEKFGWGAAASFPIFRAGTPYAVFNVYHRDKAAFDARIVELLKEMCLDISYALDMFDVATQRELAEKQVELAALVFEKSQEAIVITDGDGRILTVNQAYTTISGFDTNELIGKNITQHEENMFGRIIRNLEREDASTEEHSTGVPESEQEEEDHDLVLRKMSTGDHWQGEIWNRRKDGTAYPARASVTRVLDEQQNAKNYIGMFIDLSERKAAEETIDWLTNFDALTGLTSRALFLDRVNQAVSLAKAQGNQLAIVAVNLDNFKLINDTIGHRLGDQLLIEVARRIQCRVKKQDTLARFGGDQFMLLLPNVDVHQVTHLVEALLHDIAQPFCIDQHEFNVTSSIGIAMNRHDDADLLKCAEIALHSAKQHGRNAYRFFQPEMHQYAERHLLLENALRGAIQRGELFLHYQPQVSLKERVVGGVEALLRWEHPEFGRVSPAEFIPIAESSELILPIGEWVLKEATRQMKAWVDAGVSMTTMAVNISAVQFREKDFPQRVEQILQEVQLPAKYLELELTESMAMKEPDVVISVMDELHARGIRISIDDFGTGYSSLAYLHRFHVDKLKIDQSFVRGIDVNVENDAIVDAVLSLARSLRLRTLAEGVENEQELRVLQGKGCEEVQGYFISHPMAPKDVIDWFQEFSPEVLMA